MVLLHVSIYSVITTPVIGIQHPNLPSEGSSYLFTYMQSSAHDSEMFCAILIIVRELNWCLTSLQRDPYVTICMTTVDSTL